MPPHTDRKRNGLRYGSDLFLLFSRCVRGDVSIENLAECAGCSLHLPVPLAVGVLLLGVG